ERRGGGGWSRVAERAGKRGRGAAQRRGGGPAAERLREEVRAAPRALERISIDGPAALVPANQNAGHVAGDRLGKVSLEAPSMDTCESKANTALLFRSKP